MGVFCICFCPESFLCHDELTPGYVFTRQTTDNVVNSAVLFVRGPRAGFYRLLSLTSAVRGAALTSGVPEDV